MKILSKIVITIVVIVVFCIVGIFLNAGTGGGASWLIIALAAGMVAAIRAVWKKGKSNENLNINDIDLFDDNHKELKS
ncbi:MAG: hypothetical protein IKN91_09310 [Paludibacteraceae bacterium]|nr:hypothetical protein [Paludibacteraceae bacterium]